MEANKGATCKTCAYYDIDYQRCRMTPPQYTGGYPGDASSWNQPKAVPSDYCSLHNNFYGQYNEEPSNAD
jgi:hypothetical protein